MACHLLKNGTDCLGMLVGSCEKYCFKTQYKMIRYNIETCDAILDNKKQHLIARPRAEP